MNRSRALVVAVGMLAATGCDPLEERTSTRGDFIIGGTPAPADDQVFRLAIVGDNQVTSTCSATLIAPRTLITAAHCVDPTVLGATSVTITATNAPTVAEQTTLNTWAVTERRQHPDFRPVFGLDSDVAMVWLERAPGIAHKPWSQRTLSGLEGQPVRVLGYGAADAGEWDAGMGVRREVDLSIRQLSAELITIGDEVGRGICHGDSGGPTYLTFGDGVERLVGVHSFTRTADCVDGADTRVDAFADFIAQWLAEHEDTCAPDGICSTSTCAQPDVDCVVPGATCTYALQCEGRRCVTDLQHAELYCSASCTAASPSCASPLTCDLARGVCVLPQRAVVDPGAPCDVEASWCRVGTCNGWARDLARCTPSCSGDAQCSSNEVCRPGFTGQRSCLSAVVTLAAARSEGPARGCSTGPGSGVTLPGLLLGLLGVPGIRRRRRCG